MRACVCVYACVCVCLCVCACAMLYVTVSYVNVSILFYECHVCILSARLSCFTKNYLSYTITACVAFLYTAAAAAAASVKVCMCVCLCMYTMYIKSVLIMYDFI